MKEIVKLHSFGNGEDITISVSVSISRSTTEDEESLCRKFCRDLQELICRNNLLKDEKYMDGVSENKKKLLECFGNNLVYVKEIPNEYYSGDIEPWYIVYTPVGPIKIGWRKRVINIDWSESDVQEVGKVLFKGEETTGAHNYESVRFIHAWSYEKAAEYVQKLLASQFF